MRYTKMSLLMFVLLWMSASTAAEDQRQLVKLPDFMRDHMLSSMRDHLSAINAIQAALAKADYDKAAEIAESRIGMSSLEAHNAAHMAPFMPKPMQNFGTNMHHAASQFARQAQDVAVSGNLKQLIGGLAKITQQCVACHAKYRVH